MYIGEKDITIAELAELVDISQSTLKSLIYGTTKDCHSAHLVKLAKVLEVSIDELLGCNTLNLQTRNVIKNSRQLPDSFMYFIDWIGDYYYKSLYVDCSAEKAIPVMTPKIHNNNMQMTNNFKIVDISEEDKDLIPKVFMGIQIPCDSYVPKFFPGDILLIANDRNPKPNEDFIICTNKNLWFANKKGKDYYSAWDGSYRISEEHVTTEVGYVASIIRESPI